MKSKSSQSEDSVQDQHINSKIKLLMLPSIEYRANSKSPSEKSRNSKPRGSYIRTGHSRFEYTSQLDSADKLISSKSPIIPKEDINAAPPRANSLCARTVQKSHESSELNSYKESSQHLAPSLPNPPVKSGTSANSPDWFKISAVPSKNSDDGTISVLSKLQGWIYVDEQTKNRKSRLCKQGPFEQPNYNLQNVSDLAPNWMHRKLTITPANPIKISSPGNLSKMERRTALFDPIDPTHSDKHIKNLSKPSSLAQPRELKIFSQIKYKPRIIYEWKMQGSETKPVTWKIGQ